MIDTVLMFNLLKAVPTTARLVLVGDVDQLPAVGPGAVLRDVITSGLAAVTRLTHIFRQAQTSLIVTNAHVVQGAARIHVQLTWDDATTIAAKTLENVARTYNGLEGANRLHAQGYDPAMVDAMHGAGVQAIKMRGGMGLLGVIGKYGMYRLNNSLALLDAKVRGVGPDPADNAERIDPDPLPLD